MGNCCKKKTKEGRGEGDGSYARVQDRAAASIKEGTVINTNSTALAPGGSMVPGSIVPGTGLSPEDEKWQDFLKSLQLEPILDKVQEQVTSYKTDALKKISDDKDPYTLYFDVLTDDNKEKFHTTYMHQKSPLSPLAFKLANTLIPESEELRLSSSYERYITIYRCKIGDVFYIINHAIYKAIMLFSKKDLFIVKAFKIVNGGDLVEVTVSPTHPEYPEKKGTDRMKIISNMAYIRKTSEGGSEVTSINSLYPRTGTSFMILKPIFSKTYRTYTKTVGDYLESLNKSEAALQDEFVRYVYKPPTDL